MTGKSGTGFPDAAAFAKWAKDNNLSPADAQAAYAHNYSPLSVNFKNGTSLNEDQYNQLQGLNLYGWEKANPNAFSPSHLTDMGGASSQPLPADVLSAMHQIVTSGTPTPTTSSSSGNSAMPYRYPVMAHGGRVPHYDDGGSVDTTDWGSFDYTPYLSGDPSSDPGTTTYYGDSAPTEPTAPVDPVQQFANAYDQMSQQQMQQQGITDAWGNPTYTDNSPLSSGWLSALANFLPGGSGGTLGSWWGGLSGGQQVGALAGLGTLLGSIGSGNNTGGINMTSAYNPNPPPMFTGSGPSYSAPRTQTHPQNIDYAHYGQGPEASFFTPQAIAPQGLTGSSNIQTVSPLAAGSTPVQSPSPTMSILPYLLNQQNNTQQPRAVMAHGGSPLAQSAQHVKGPGDGTSDDIPTRLSSGEYVIDAGSVSMLGNGDNDAGARRLDEMRANLRKHAGKSLVKGKQFMKAKAPERYMNGEAE